MFAERKQNVVLFVQVGADRLEKLPNRLRNDY